jgi:capsular exopolysaccharide synthesis family protein
VRDESVDIQRYAAALRRNWWRILAVVVVVTAAVVAIAYALPKTYSASATVVFNPNATLLGPTDSTSVQRELATYESYVQSPAVINSAAQTLGERKLPLEQAVQASADPNANLITITATAPGPRLAAGRANAVANAFLASQKYLQTAGFQSAQARLQTQIAELKNTPGARAQIASLRSRISALQISAAGTSSQLQIANPATVPASASSPKPLLDGAIALVASLLLMVLIVLGRDQLTPKFSSPRELGRLLSLPVFAGVPYRKKLVTRKRRRALTAIEHEAYDSLQAAVRVTEGRNQGTRVILITSTTHSEGKTTVTASLARSLARSGTRVLLISGDLRSPALHDHFELTRGNGLVECLTVAITARNTIKNKLPDYIRSVPGELNLDFLDAGDIPAEPTSLLSGNALSTLFGAIKQLEYGYVLVDSAPIVGIGDTQFLARGVDDMLVVARLDTVSRTRSEDLVDLLQRLRLRPLGLVVIGAQIELSPYYLTGPLPRPVAEASPVSSKERRSGSGSPSPANPA